MEPLCGRERVGRQLKHLPVDRIAVSEEFWSYTIRHWEEQGKLPPGTDAVEHFKLDLDKCWAFNLRIDPEMADRLVAEDEETRTFVDGNGATLRRYRSHASTPEHINFSVVDRNDWEEKAKPFLTPTANRIDFEGYRAVRRACADAGRFFLWSGVNVFESMHPICGHENLLMGMALDPEWVSEMAEVYSDLIIHLWETLFAAEGKPDGIWFYEDMGFKGRPFMSPEMYRELIMPAHRKTIDFAHSLGLPVVMHSCGFVEPLLPYMVEAGIDCLQAMEVKAGMDLLRIYRDFGEKIALMGGLDVRPVANNDLPGIRRELETRIPVVKGRNGFILHSDHSIPESAEYESYRYFLETGLELGRY